MTTRSSAAVGALLAVLCCVAARGADESSLTVSVDGQGGAFKTVQAAVDLIPAGNDRPRVIVIRPGTYKERITVPKGKRFITFKGDDADARKTVLTFNLVASMLKPGTTQPI